MRKLLQGVYSLLVIAIIVALAYLSQAPQEGRLVYENRNRQPRPRLNKETLFSGQYFPQIEKYISDNFKYREEVLASQNAIDIDILNRPIVSNVYRKGNLLLPLGILDLPDPADAKQGSKLRAQDYKDLSDKIQAKGAHFIYLGIPDHASAFSEAYPSFSPKEGQIKEAIEETFFQELDKRQVRTIKARDFLTPQDHYNTTDHHFSFIGATRTYIEIIKTINTIEPLGLDPYNIELEKLDKPFKGSYGRKLFYHKNYKDTAWIYKPDFTLKGTDKKGTKRTLFRLEEQETDTIYNYGIYMGGDIGQDTLETGRENLPTILVYGDSFTNPIETLLIRNAKTLHSFDFRYYTEESLLEAIERTKPDFVICIRDDTSYLQQEGNGLTQ